jgi:hypothetical protein
MTAYTIAGLDDICDVIHVFCPLLPRTLETLHRLDFLIKLTFQDGELTSQFQGFDVNKFQWFARLGNNGRRWGPQVGVHHCFDTFPPSFLVTQFS